MEFTGFKRTVSALAHTAAIVLAEAFIGFRDLLDFLACKKTSSPIGAIQNSPVPLRDLAPVPVEFIGVVGTVSDERNIFVPNRNKCFIVVDFAAHIRRLLCFDIWIGAQRYSAPRYGYYMDRHCS